jgi:hypothetical protein
VDALKIMGFEISVTKALMDTQNTLLVSEQFEYLESFVVLLSTLKQMSATGWTAEGSEFETREGQGFIQVGSGAHSASSPMCIRAKILGVKRPGREADHSTPTSAVIKKTWIYTSTPPYILTV